MEVHGPAGIASSIRQGRVAPQVDAARCSLSSPRRSHPDHDAYSGFHGTELAKILRAKGVRKCGVRHRDGYCVQATAHDAFVKALKC